MENDLHFKVRMAEWKELLLVKKISVICKTVGLTLLISYALLFVWQTCGSYLSALRPKVNETIKRKWRPSGSVYDSLFFLIYAASLMWSRRRECYFHHLLMWKCNLNAEGETLLKGICIFDALTMFSLNLVLKKTCTQDCLCTLTLLVFMREAGVTDPIHCCQLRYQQNI